MSVMSIRIDDRKRKLLKAIASIEGRSMTEVVSQLLDEYVQQRKAQLGSGGSAAEVQAIMKLSEASFADWDNAEDEIYDNL